MLLEPLLPYKDERGYSRNFLAPEFCISVDLLRRCSHASIKAGRRERKITTTMII
jgi:hypothetical protein